VILVNQAAESIDTDGYTLIQIPGDSRLRRLERQAAVTCPIEWSTSYDGPIAISGLGDGSA
jgi:hypothetical protein